MANYQHLCKERFAKITSKMNHKKKWFWTSNYGEFLRNSHQKDDHNHKKKCFYAPYFVAFFFKIEMWVLQKKEYEDFCKKSKGKKTILHCSFMLHFTILSEEFLLKHFQNTPLSFREEGKISRFFL